ncbi:MAG TPA: right-handed parallel beta-helix repeat-containing protein [Bacteroidales bacterium]|nr:right-handed parallel beta-helix repeat-containing protein [Bacteroidales bacterium]
MKINAKNIFLVVISLTTMYSFSKGQTPVGGGIYSNTTWSLANSPYIVTDTVVVFPGVTLTIEPGVTVKFEDNQRLEIRQAHLISVGTVTDSITFTSNSSTPTPGIWSGIFLNECPNPIEFNYCNFKYAYVAIDKQAYDNDILVIKNSNFNFNYSGISNLTYAISGTTIDSCNFENNTYGIGRIIRGFDAIIKNSNFINNQTGIRAAQGIPIENCVYISNQIGIFRTGGLGYIKNCLIDSNSTAGIILSHTGDDEIINCQIKHNGIGIYDSLAYSGNKIRMNIIENNTIGTIVS